MLRRRTVALAAALAIACVPEVEQGSQPESFAVAVLDPATGTLPFPNDVALANLPPAGAQRDALVAIIAAGGFPAATPVTIPMLTFQRNATTGVFEPVLGTPPAVDASTATPQTVAFLRYDVSPPAPVPFTAVYGPTPQTANQLVLNHAPLAAGGRYVVALRAGGIRTADGGGVGASLPFALIAPNEDLSVFANQPPTGLTPAQLVLLEGGAPPAPPLGLRDFYALPLQWRSPGPALWIPDDTSATPLTPFAAVSTVFPSEEIASIQTFEIAP
jgi:hypothetical protein